jgi:hypothetical protein
LTQKAERWTRRCPHAFVYSAVLNATAVLNKLVKGSIEQRAALTLPQARMRVAQAAAHHTTARARLTQQVLGWSLPLLLASWLALPPLLP